jgi:hypothetical protein
MAPNRCWSAIRLWLARPVSGTSLIV